MQGSTVYRVGCDDPEKLLDEILRSLDPFNNPKYKDRNDISLSGLFSDIFINTFRFNGDYGCFYVYDGARWIQDKRLTVRLYAESFFWALRRYSADIQDTDYFKYIATLGNHHKVETLINGAKSHNAIRLCDLDRSRNLLNVQNGVIDLDTGALWEHDPGLYLSKVANVNYDPDADSSVWENFMNEIMKKNKNDIQYLQKVCGYCLTGETNQEKAHFAVGDGRNGKTVFAETYASMLGDYADHISPESLAQKKSYSGSNASPDIAKLIGKRFVIASEPPKKMFLDESLFKTITGRDTITTRPLYRDPVTFEPEFKLFLVANHLPIISDDVVFSSGRVVVIPFTRTFSEDEQDKTLKDRLRSPEVLSGILKWCIEGLRLYRAEGLKAPETIRNATSDYQRRSDKIGNFIDECLERDDKRSVTVSSVYEEYKSWCISGGMGVDGKRSFIADLRSKNMVSDRGTVDGVSMFNVIKGYRIREEVWTECAPEDSPFME